LYLTCIKRSSNITVNSGFRGKMRNILIFGGSNICMDRRPITEIEILISQECKLKGYSQKTIKSYLHHIKKFLASKKTPRDYLLTLIKKNKSDETVRSAGFAVKFYLKTIKEFII